MPRIFKNIFFSPRAPRGVSSGFTLIELLMVVAIMIFMTSIVVINRRDYDNSVLLTNLAYDVALSIREAQVYGIAVRRSSAKSFDQGYGIHFEERTLPNGNQVVTSYSLFADGSNSRPRNNAYDVGEDILSPSPISLNRGYRLDFCGNIAALPPNNFQYCNLNNGTIEMLDIVFVRPDPDAFFSLTFQGAIYTNAALDKVGVRVISPQGSTRDVVIYRNGQIAVCSVGGC